MTSSFVVLKWSFAAAAESNSSFHYAYAKAWHDIWKIIFSLGASHPHHPNHHHHHQRPITQFQMSRQHLQGCFRFGMPTKINKDNAKRERKRKKHHNGAIDRNYNLLNEFGIIAMSIAVLLPQIVNVIYRHNPQGAGKQLSSFYISLTFTDFFHASNLMLSSARFHSFS